MAGFENRRLGLNTFGDKLGAMRHEGGVFWIVTPFQGSVLSPEYYPGALPRAGLLRPVGAGRALKIGAIAPTFA